MKKIILILGFLFCSTLLFAGSPTGTPIYNASPLEGDDFFVGSTTITSAGLAVQLGTKTAIREIIIQAKQSNSGRIYVGDENIDYSDTGGIYLSAGSTLRLYLTDMTLIYLDGTVSGDGITYLGW